MAPSSLRCLKKYISSLAFLWLLTSCLATGISGCVHSMARDLRTQNLKIILSRPASTPDELLRRGWAGFMLDSNWDKALDDLTKTSFDIMKNAAPSSDFAVEQHLLQMANLGKGLIVLLRAEFRQAMPLFLKTIEVNPLSPEALVAARQLAEVAFQVKGGHARISNKISKILKSIMQTPEAPGSRVFIARTLRKILRDAARRQGSWEQVKALESSMGLVPVWRVAAPFGKHPLADMNIAMEPEHKGLDSVRLSEGMFSWPLWPVRLAITTAVPGGAGILYAESFFCLDKPSHLLIRIKGRSPWTVFIDDKKIAAHDSELHYLPEVDLRAVTATRGWHRLLLKVASWKQDETIGVELTKADGTTKGVKWWSWPQKSPDYSPGGASPVTASVKPPRYGLAQRLHKNPNDSISAVLAAMLMWDAGDIQRAEKLLDEALRTTPDFAFARYLRALIILDDSNIPSGMDKTRSREVLDSLTKSHPGFHLAAFRRALLLSDDNERNQALSILNELEKKRPDCALWQNYAGTIQQKAGRTQEARLSLQRALNRLPDNTGLLMTLLDMAGANSAFSEQTLYAEKLESLGEDPMDVAELWRRLGKTHRAISVLEKEIQLNPSNIQARLQLSEFLQSVGRADEALALLTQTRILAPYEVAISFRLADALDRTGKKTTADRIRKELSWRNPWHLGLRKVFAAQKNLRRINISGDKPEDGLEIIRKFQASKKSYSGDSIILLDRAAAEIAPNGSSISRVHTIVQVLSPDGVERWGEISSIPGSAQIELIRTISKDGDTVDAEVIPGKQSVTLQGLQVGSFVEFQYVNVTPPSGPTVNAWLGNTFLMELPGIPILKSIYSLAVPKGTDLSIELGNQAPNPTLSHFEKHEVYTFELKDASSVPIEIHGPVVRELVPYIRAAFGVSWQDIRDGLRSNLLFYSRSTNELERFAKKTIAGKDPEQGIRALFRKVCSDIRQSTPSSSFSRPASHILALKEGNRLLLLYALLRTLGYRPRLVLARTIADPQSTQKVPSGDAFPYGLIAVDLKAKGKNKTLWLDPSSRFSPFDEIFPFLAGMQALDVTGTDPSKLFISLPSDHTRNLKKDIHLDLVLSPDGTIEGTGHETITTWQSVSYREALQSMNKSLQQQALEAGLAGTFGGAMLEEFSFIGLHDPDRPLVIKYKFRAPAWARRRGNLLILQGGIYPYELGRNLIAYNARQTPLLLADRTDTITHVSIKLPAGAKIEQKKDTELKATKARFQMKVSQKDSLLIMDKRLVVEAGRIQPAEYPSFKNFCHMVDNADTGPLVVELQAIPGI